MTKLSHSVLAKIKAEARHPLARWRVLARRGAIWLLVLVSVLALASFLGSLLAELIATEWSLAPRWPGRTFGLLRDTIAWFWVGGATLALAGGIVFFRRTTRGYRYGAGLILTLLAATGIIAGALLLPTSVPRYLHVWHDEYLPPMLATANFHAPGEGRLVGTITSILDTETIILTDITQQNWEVWLLGGEEVALDDLVVVFGEVIDETTFAALSVRLVPSHYSVQEFLDTPRMMR